MFRTLARCLSLGCCLAALCALPAKAQDDLSAAELAQALENPIYYRVTLPLQNNYDCCYSPEGGYKYTSTFQPVIPLGRFSSVEVISRTLAPVVYEFNTKIGQGGHVGWGDVTQAFYVGQESGKSFYYGAGPIFLIPSGDTQISNRQWAAGPTFALGGKSGRFSASFMFWHYWSFAGDTSVRPVSRTRLQPALGYTFFDSTTLKVGVDADYDWVRSRWSAPFHAGVSHVFKLRSHTVQLALAAKIFTPSASGPQDGVRFTATYVFPR
jgi:hypothetical protein